MQNTIRLRQITTALFALGVALFFAKSVAMPYKVAYPVALLALSVFAMRQRSLFPVGAALLCSAVGDVMGAEHLFIPQMLCFALAHGAYIWYFLPRSAHRPRLFPVLLPVLLLGFLFGWILPHATIPAERIGVAVYGVVIATMLYSVLQYRGAYAAWFRCAALLFVFSDAVIAWCRFVDPLPGRTYIIMTTYYLAQYLFYRFAIQRDCRS